VIWVVFNILIANVSHISVVSHADQKSKTSFLNVLSLHPIIQPIDQVYTIVAAEILLSSVSPSIVWHLRLVISNSFFVVQLLHDHVVAHKFQLDSISHQDVVSKSTDQLSGVSRFIPTHLQIRALFFASSIRLIIFTTSISDCWFFESLLKSILLIPKANIHIIAIHTIISPSVNAFVMSFLYIKSCQITKKI